MHTGPSPSEIHRLTYNSKVAAKLYKKKYFDLLKQVKLASRHKIYKTLLVGKEEYIPPYYHPNSRGAPNIVIWIEVQPRNREANL